MKEHSMNLNLVEADVPKPVANWGPAMHAISSPFRFCACHILGMTRLGQGSLACDGIWKCLKQSTYDGHRVLRDNAMRRR